MIQDAYLFALPLIQQNQIKWIESIDSPPEWVWCDEDLIRQILLNLILNAVEAMPRGGELRLEVLSRRDPAAPGSDSAAVEGMTMRISDTGAGISQEILPKIFDPFFTTKQSGTGLGLAIVHNAVTAHGGSIQVQSEVGRGTALILELPSLRPINRSEEKSE